MIASHRPKNVHSKRCSPLSRFAMLLGLCLLICAQVGLGQGAQQSVPESGPVHIVRKTDANPQGFSPQAGFPNSPSANLDYYGGPVVSNIQVVVVFWGPRVSSTVTTQIGPFFQAVTKSSYFDLMSEYSTSVTPLGGGSGTKQSIGRGDYAGDYTINPSVCSTAPCTATDTQIRAELLKQITAGNLPSPELDSDGNVNTLYMIYFPPEVSITQGGTGSCVSGGFCAYHGTTSSTFNSKHLLYGVVPDFGAGSGCDVGCGAGTEFQNVSSVSSHEVAETVTDADVGIATSYAPPLAWYDAHSTDQDGGGEIGDICNAEQALISVGGSNYTVQKLWSNFKSACVSIGAHPSFDLSAPAAALGGTSFNFTLTVQNPVGSSTDTSFVGTAHFTSSDPQATLPADYAFSPADQGTQTFGATLKNSGSQTITATDTVNGAITGVATLTVNPTAPSITSANTTTFAEGTAGSFTVTATGLPTPTLTRTGTLPSGVSFIDNGNGTGTLSGTPAAGTSGTYSVTFKAHNTVAPDATQTFTLAVNAPPSITSPNSTTFTVGALGTFIVTTTGTPTPSLSSAGTLPSGVSFVDDGDGKGTLSGTPGPGSNGTYNITFRAHNTVAPDATQSFKLTVNSAPQSPAITSANNTTFTAGTAGLFTVTATGIPNPSLSASGTLPTGVSFIDNGNGTGTLSGTPAAGTNGTYSISFKAHNTTSPDATQSFTLTVNAAPTITSANNATFTVGSAGSFSVTATGTPAPSFTSTGTLPAGVSFVDNGNGIGTLSGTPAAGTNGTYNITFTAHNTTSPDATQTFTLTVNAAPAITSPSSTFFTVGSAGSFTVTASGTPTPSLKISGTLPTGVKFVDNGNGTGTLSGTPAAGTNRIYSITFTAHNTISPDATQTFSLVVTVAPVITSANNTAFVVGTAGSFTVTSKGTPTPSLTSAGTLPTGVSFVDNGDGTGTLGGTPAAGTNGMYTITFTAHNTDSPDATQTFTLTVNAAPAITSTNTATFAVGMPGSFNVTATGTPVPTLTKTGALPSGITFVDNGNGTGTLSGTPASGTNGVYNFTFTAHNAISPDATQAFTLAVNQAPAITSANSAIFIAGTAGSFTVTATGTPTPSLTESGALPAGVSFVNNGNGTATLSGTPASGTVGNYSITITAHNAASPDASQAFTLTVNPGAQAPAFTSASGATFTVGMAGSFTVSATGTPTPSLTKTGALPSGVTFVDNKNGTGTLSGTPATGTNKTYSITFTAHNTASPDATQAFTLTVKPAQPQISITPASLDFGDIDLNALAQKTVTLKNTGSSTISLGTISLTQNQSNVFNYTTNCGTSLLSGKSCAVYVSYYAAASQQTDNATLNIADNVSSSPQKVPITAHTTQIDIRFTPASLTFLPIKVGTSETHNVTVTNLANSSLTLNSIQLGGANLSDYSETDNCPAVLNSKAHCVVKLIFTPTETGVRNGNLVVTANGGSTQQTMSFSGTGN